ncbi:MAG: two-component system chemotaxis response regulator CheY [Paraglaciecola sp.]|jgi:two-component system chemotaxis response regulator CheY
MRGGGVDMSTINVLIIDDDEITLTLLENIVKELVTGNIFVFSNSIKAKAFLHSREAASVGLVICDWQMPSVTGIHILETLRDNYASCPFLMITVNPTKDLVNDAIRLSVTDFMVKPFSSDNITKKISLMLANIAK